MTISHANGHLINDFSYVIFYKGNVCTQLLYDQED